MKRHGRFHFTFREHLPVLTGLILPFLLVSCGSDTDKESVDQFIPYEEWHPMIVDNLGFRIDFPKKPTERVESFDSGGATATAYIYGYKHVAFEYAVTVVKLPAFQVDNSRPEVVLEYAIQSLVHEKGGKLIRQYDINLNGYPGRRAYIEYPDSFLKDVRLNTVILLRQNLVYRISTSGLGNKDEVSHFLNSFSIIPRR